MERKEIQIILLTSVILFITIVGMILLFLYVFQKKKTEYIAQKREQEKRFAETIIRSQMEIKENTLKNIAWELHDNIGQILSLAKMELNILSMQDTIDKQHIKEVSDIVGKSLQEIRMFSRILNKDVIKSIGIQQAIQIEIDRLNRLNFIQSKLVVEGTPYWINKNDEIILFRIIQEFFSNTIKHSQAKNLIVKLIYSPNNLIITLQDDGIGFDKKKVKKGTGLLSMSGRAKMINTQLDIQSGETGTLIRLEYPYLKRKNYA